MRVNHADVVIDALRAVLPSAVPALVFTDLAAACVPTFSNRCHILHVWRSSGPRGRRA